ncbi:beta-lactamase family protein [Aliiglaciecola sp.]|nr:beta-lactamase family protein [Aliiglaciecola sp.]
MKFFHFVLFASLFTSYALAQERYFPQKGEWQSRSPESQGLNANGIEQAVRFAQKNEYSGAIDLKIAILKGFEGEPFHEILGPTKDRGGPAGVILKNGYMVAKWGDIDRVDMTFSVTKSYLSTIAGLAVDKQLIRRIDDKVTDYVWDGSFQGRHNQQIQWDHLLNQSSDWTGELFGIKDWADRPPKEGDIDDWRNRALNPPGTVMEYNDVRVNLLAYSLLQVWRQPLPKVIKQYLMDPIGASTTWRWFGYDHAWVNVDGQKVQSVTGGGHSGGGVFISTLDQARFGLLFARDGNWNGQQVISKTWIEKALTPSQAHDSYGFMWWLNQGQRKWQQVDDTSLYYAAGFGGNFIVIDSRNDLVVITRWLEPSKIGEMMKLVLEAQR